MTGDRQAPLNERSKAAIQAAVVQWQQEPTFENADLVRIEIAAAAVHQVQSQADEAGARWRADQHLRALLRYTESFYAHAIEHGMNAGQTANAIAHVERAGKALHGLVHSWSNVAESRKQLGERDGQDA